MQFVYDIFMCSNQRADITLNSGSLKLVDRFTYFVSSFPSTENYINTLLVKAWTAIDWLSVIRKSELSDKIKRNCFLAVLVSILLYEITTWTLTKRIEKKLDGNCTRKLRAILNKSSKKHPTKQQLYGQQPPFSKNIQIRRTR